jgi:fructose-1,6-bisphosphatase
MVSKAGVQDLTGLAGTGENIQGEEQKKLDILSNDVFKDKLTKTGCMVSAAEASLEYTPSCVLPRNASYDFEGCI